MASRWTRWPVLIAAAGSTMALVLATGRMAPRGPIREPSRATHRPGPPDVGSALLGAAEKANRSDRYAEAENLARQALAIREKVFGPEHPAPGPTAPSPCRLTGLSLPICRGRAPGPSSPGHRREKAGTSPFRSDCDAQPVGCDPRLSGAARGGRRTDQASDRARGGVSRLRTPELDRCPRCPGSIPGGVRAMFRGAPTPGASAGPPRSESGPRRGRRRSSALQPRRRPRQAGPVRRGRARCSGGPWRSGNRSRTRHPSTSSMSSIIWPSLIEFKICTKRPNPS